MPNVSKKQSKSSAKPEKTSKKAKKPSKPAVPEGMIEHIKLSDNQRLEISVFARTEGDDEDATVYLNLRKFYRTKKDPQWKPARQGMTLPLDLAKKLRVKMKSVQEAAEDDTDNIPEVGGSDE